MSKELILRFLLIIWIVMIVPVCLHGNIVQSFEIKQTELKKFTLENCLQGLSETEFWIGYVEVEIKLNKGEGCFIGKGIQFHFANEKQPDLKLNFNGITTLEVGKNHRLQAIGNKGGKYNLFLNFQKTTVSIYLYENYQTNPFKGNCLFKYSRCIKDTIYIQGDTSDVDEITVYTKLDEGQLELKTISKDEDNRYVIPTPQLGTYIFIVSIPSKSIFYGLKDIKVSNAPEFKLDRYFYIEGQESQITLTSSIEFDDLTLKCNDNPEDNEVTGRYHSNNVWSFNLIQGCEYAFTEMIKLEFDLKPANFTNELGFTTLTRSEFPVVLTIPENTLLVDDLYTKIENGSNVLVDLLKSGSSLTIKKSQVTASDDYFLKLYYQKDTKYPLFSLPISFASLRIEVNSLGTDKLLFHGLKCIPQPIEIENHLNAAYDATSKKSLKSICLLSVDYINDKNINTSVSKEVTNYLLKNTYSEMNLYDFNTMTISLDTFESDTIGKYPQNKKDQLTDFEYIKINPPFDINYGKTKNNYSENNDGHQINKTMDFSEVQSNNITATVDQPTFQLLKDVQFINKDIPSPKILLSVKFKDQQTANDYKTRTYLDNDQMICEVDDILLNCTLAIDNLQVQIFEVKLLILDSAMYTEGKQFSVYLYAIPKENNYCQFNDAPIPIIIQFEFLPTDDSSRFTAELRDEQGYITVAGQNMINFTSVEFVFNMADTTPNKYKIFLEYDLHEEQIEVDTELIILEKKTIHSIEPLFGSSSLIQEFKITFNQTVTSDDIKEFKFTLESKDDPNTFTQTFTCEPDIDLKEFQCKQKFDNWPFDKKYLLSWTNICNESTLHDKEITFVPSAVTLVDVTPNEFQLINFEVKVALTYQPNAEDVHSIILIDKDGVIIDQPISVSVYGDTSKVYAVIEDTQLSGLFRITTILMNNTHIESSEDITLLLYKNKMILPHKYQTYSKDTPLNKLTVKFQSDLFKSRFSSIQYHKYNSDVNVPIDYDKYEVDRDSDQATLTLPDDFKVDGTYFFEFEDRATDDDDVEKIFTFALITKELPSKAKLSESIYFKVPIQVEFDVDLGKDDFIAETSDSEFSFTKVQVDSKTIQLELTPLKPGVTYGIKKLTFLYDGIDFIYPNPYLIVIDDDTYPHTIKTTNIALRTIDLSFKVQIEEQLYSEYYSKLTAKVENGEDCSIYISLKDNSFELTCPSIIGIVGDYKIGMTFYDIDITSSTPIKVKVVDCSRNQIYYEDKCQLCSDIEEYKDKPYVDDGICVQNCSNSYVIWNFACYMDCDEPGLIPPLFLKEDRKECIETCDNVFYEKNCYEKCPQTSTGGPLYPNGKECVEKCPEGKGLNDKDECIECELGEDNLHCKKTCPSGTILDKNEHCVLIDESHPITKCEDYCRNYLSCAIRNFKAVCECKVGFYGIYCEIAQDKLVEFINEAKKIFVEQLTVDEAKLPFDPQTISNILNMKNILRDRKDQAYDIEVKLDSITQRLIPNQLIISTQLFIDLSLTILRHKILNPNHRNSSPSKENTIEDEKTLVSDIQEIIKANSNYLNKQYVQMADGSTCLPDENENIFCLSFLNTMSSYEKYQKEAKDKQLTIISQFNTITPYLVVEVVISAELNRLITSINSASSQVYFEVLNPVDGTSVILTDSSHTLKVEIMESMDKSNYIYYYDRGIDIYNSKAQAFTELCYTNELLEYDLVQEYRKYHLFQNKTIASKNNNCEYQGMDSETQLINMFCLSISSTPTENYYILENAELIDISHGTQNIPTQCIKYVKNIHNNVAFWIFLLTSIVFIITSIVIVILRHCNVINYNKISVIQNDNSEILITDFVPLNDNQSDLNNSQNQKINNSINKQVIKKTLAEKLTKNMLNLHPLTFICQDSISNPFTFKMMLFVFNLFSQFGFLAVYYFEHMIDMRRTKTDRDYFVYTLIYEYDKMIYAVLSSIACTIVIKIIVLISLSKKRDFDTKIAEAQSEEAKLEIYDLLDKNMRLRRLLAIAAMMGVSIFFFVYCVVFCGIYINTQITWLYSCLWIITFNWVLLSPLVILVFSLVESLCECRDCSYYFKNVFIF